MGPRGQLVENLKLMGNEATAFFLAVAHASDCVASGPLKYSDLSICSGSFKLMYNPNNTEPMIVCRAGVLCCSVLCHMQPDDLATLLSALRSLGAALTPGLLAAAADVAVANMGSFSLPRLVELLQVRV
jgi:hypothetical protein